ncbi:putative RNA-directed DNA polymerase [Arabidopsis thaliana]
MNVLSCMLDKAAVEKKISYHPRCRNMNLTHLCFTDDIMVFSDGTSKSIQGTLAIFEKFAAMSGLKISLEKSTIFMAGISPNAKTSILQQFPFELGTLPVKYLGLPLLTKRMTQSDYLPLMEKIRARITSWTNRFLSFAGRLQLIKSVLSSITNFWLSVFRLPKACLQEIEKMFSAFLWSGPDLNTKKAKIAWSEVCKLKEEGGLGLKPLKEANEVSLLKLIWRILSARDSLWVKWVNKHLIRRETFWSVKENTGLGSWLWRKILKQRDKARLFHRMEVRSGTFTSFWHDHWCPLGRLHQHMGSRGTIDLGIPNNAKVAEVMNTHRRKRHRADFLNQIESQIELARQDRSTDGDRSLWKQKEDTFKSSFSSSKTWQQIRSISLRCDWYRGVWFSTSTPKYSFVTWLAFHNRLTTSDKICKWNSGARYDCVFCGEELETRDHLFFSCPYSSHVWFSLTKGLLNGRNISNWNLITPHLLDSSRPYLHVFTLRYAFQASIHSLWRERNCRRHGETAIPAAKLAKFIDKTIRNRFSTIQRSGNTRLHGGLQYWFHTRC